MVDTVLKFIKFNLFINFNLFNLFNIKNYSNNCLILIMPLFSPDKTRKNPCFVPPLSRFMTWITGQPVFVCFLTSSSTTRLYRGRAPRQDFCLSRSHYTDTDPTCRERAATAGIEPGVTGYFGTGRIGTIPIYPGPSGRIFRNHSD